MNKHILFLFKKVCKLWRQIQVTCSDKEKCSDQKSKKKIQDRSRGNTLAGPALETRMGLKVLGL